MMAHGNPHPTPPRWSWYHKLNYVFWYGMDTAIPIVEPTVMLINAFLPYHKSHLDMLYHSPVKYVGASLARAFAIRLVFKGLNYLLPMGLPPAPAPIPPPHAHPDSYPNITLWIDSIRTTVILIGTYYRMRQTQALISNSANGFTFSA